MQPLLALKTLPTQCPALGCLRSFVAHPLLTAVGSAARKPSASLSTISLLGWAWSIKLGLTHGVASGLARATALSAAYLFALFGSMTIYRLFFHQLREFPAPSWPGSPDLLLAVGR